ncbi:mitochondrial import inner membrane translocase subunit Tim9-like [Echinops telfairi]|uniref:Mitochondrial import inner membrane translocase subunit n=1 Tax=Echinops telfairi TaxID=9371 RepID=A0ABM0ZT45_ECHTE|nr:mitochondrial import inner membrane translocase subunit Tim9-like [Echinops telfairi]
MAVQIPESDQIKQFKEFLGTYNKLTETCYGDCVKDFTTREVEPEEQNEALAAKAGLLSQPRWRWMDLGWDVALE